MLGNCKEIEIGTGMTEEGCKEPEEKERAVIFGAGVFGRAVLAPFVQKLGYDLTFVTHVDEQARFLNISREYRLVRFKKKSEEDQKPGENLFSKTTRDIKDFNAVSIKDQESINKLFRDSKTELVCTCVRTENIKDIIGPLNIGLIDRDKAISDEERKKIVILVCENSVDAHEHISKSTRGIGSFILCPDIIVDCIVPYADRFAQKLFREWEHHFWIEKSGLAHLDKKLQKRFGAKKGIIIKNRKWMDLYRIQKLWGLNSFHLAIAILGKLLKTQYVHEAIEAIERIKKPDQADILKNLMKELASAIHLRAESYIREKGLKISKLEFKKEFSVKSLQKKLSEIEVRFANPALKDSNERVARNLERKLQLNERLLAPLETLLNNQGKEGVKPVKVLPFVVASGLFSVYPNSDPQEEMIRDFLGSVWKLDKNALPPELLSCGIMKFLESWLEGSNSLKTAVFREFFTFFNS